MRRLIVLLFTLIPIFFLTGFDKTEDVGEKEVNVLVVAIYGVEIAKNEWQPTIDYLQMSLPQYRFNLIPVPPDKLDYIKELIASEEINFIVSQPAIYVDLELNFGISRILTMVKNGALSEFGSTLIVRSDSGINTVRDLHGKTIGGVANLGFGGWLVGYKEMLDQGFDPYKDAKEVLFLGDQPNEIQAVLDRDIDAAVIRTGTLEKFSKINKINVDDFRVLAPKKYPHFPLMVSTELYPEWAFAKTRNSSNTLSREVALALLSQGVNSKIAQKAGFQEWTLPYDYQPVHKLLKELRVGPYKEYGKITLFGFIAQHMIVTSIILVLTISIILMSIKIYLSNISLSKEIAARKQARQEIKRHVNNLEKALDEIQTLRGIIPICSYCKKIRDDEGAWGIIEDYISNHSEAEFSHGICPECYQKQLDEINMR
jgi:two-component system, LuxR family, sensor histidine kinase TtrS